VSILPRWIHFVAILIILVGYWIAFAAYPLPPADFDYNKVGVPSDWPYHHSGFAAHWNKNSNLASEFEVWWMNLFPREKQFEYSSGGYVTLSFIPTLATMLLGLIAGNWLRDDFTISQRISYFFLAIVVCFSVAWGVDAAGLCPIVKRIWTPTWVLWSGGWCFAFLLSFYLIADVATWKSWAFPFTVIGSNSIAAYVMSYVTAPFFEDRLTVWFRPIWNRPDGFFPHSTEVLVGAITFTLIWLILYWMNRHKLYLRI
jgi:predicted acyltransferase